MSRLHPEILHPEILRPEILRPDAAGAFVILCDHASNEIPPELQQLGLPSAELARHIAWDIGAAGVARELSRLLQSPAVLCGVSRLVIDCNRHLNAADLIPRHSDGIAIPGNANLTADDRSVRIARWFHPYCAAVEAILDARRARSLPCVVLSIHSMTPRLAGQDRPWQISISSHTDRGLADPLLHALREPGDISVGDNQPYDLDPLVDFSIPFHAMRRGLPCLQVEFRQDEIAGSEGQISWAARLSAALSRSVTSPVTRSRDS